MIATLINKVINKQLFCCNDTLCKQKIFPLLCFAFFLTFTSTAQTSIPHLQTSGNTTQLIVNNQPFLILGGELGNSSASSRAFMQPVWSKLQAMHMNTVLIPVYWELIEPEENKFDFTLVDSLIADAANHNLHLVLLWFGTWKNSMSVYVPEWVKRDTKRFKRTINKEGRSMEIISALSKEALDADCKAFAALMKHIKTTDGGRQTVIMVQVENEVGMLSTAKETQPDALQLFNGQVPAALMQYLQQHKNNIVPELKEKWSKSGYKAKGSWEEVFGRGWATDEIFQAYLYASYVDKVAAAGKQEYNIPMYVNAALNRPGVLPGNYPSAGPLPQVMDIWKIAAPHIDFLSPDFYNPDTKYWCDLYTRRNNTLFIPEIRFDSSDAAKALFTIGHYHSLGFSPFAVERGSEKATSTLQKGYSVLQQLTPFITQSTPSQMDGVLLDKQNEIDTFSFDKYVFKVSHDNTLGWNGHKGDSLWDATGAIIIQTAPDEFIVGGTGIVINFSCTDTAYNAGILAIENGTFDNGNWQPNLRLNGDEDHQGRHLRIPLNEWDIQKVKLYRYR